MRLSPQHYAIALYESLSMIKPEETERVLDNFVKILEAAGRIAEFENVAEEFLKYEQRQKGLVATQVSYARKDSLEATMLETLNGRLGGNRLLSQRMEAGLIGGVVIESEDELLDASVKKSLESLKKSLISE
ncbi:MAG: F0F1 ATP synthase subunit delta [Candidatus Doudnabacteria bacterium]|nr:F0F1 ATP synthase subunit delta [Candidatus Doudnabacteria bacterium]